jgi:regulator of replication initiation timing
MSTLSEGAVSDKSGRATSILLEKSGYTGSLTGLSSLLNAMESSGLITREVRGKRCFVIAAANSNHIVPPDINIPDAVESIPQVPPPIEQAAPAAVTPMNVSALAKALLEQVIEIAGTPQRQSFEQERLKTEFEQMQQRLFETTERAEKARQRVRLLEDELAARKVENDGLRMRLTETERNLNAVINSPNGVRLDVERERELRDLIRLMKAPNPIAQ